MDGGVVDIGCVSWLGCVDMGIEGAAATRGPDFVCFASNFFNRRRWSSIKSGVSFFFLKSRTKPCRKKAVLNAAISSGPVKPRQVL